MPAKKRYNIGLLATELVDFNDRELFRGLTDLSRELDFNLVYFHGGRMDDPIGFNAQGNAIYKFIGKENVDALIIWSTALCRFKSPEWSQAFCDSFRPLPVVGIGAPLVGIPSVLAESYLGMFEIIEHLITLHNLRRIAFIHGPLSHYDNQERFRAYRDVLAKHGIPFDLNLVSSHGDWNIEHGKTAIRQFLDERKTPVDAIVGASILFSIGAIMELKKRKIRVPQDIAMVGFDDKPLCRVFDPPLSTVPIMLYERGRLAGRLLLKLLNGETVPLETVVSCKPIIRRSCGCNPILSVMV
ncbi:MAG: LacI family transcriptional regulator, partial [Spirochaetaceae bacterium]